MTKALGFFVSQSTRYNKSECRDCNRSRKRNLNHAPRRARRRAAKLQAIPKWADLELIKVFYQLCRQRTELTGLPHHVDHIIPLQSELVCGLHIINNLQILTATENCQKSNVFWPDMPD